jgi:hypothetical protein
VRGFEDHDVGDHVKLELVGTDVERGFIDFVRVCCRTRVRDASSRTRSNVRAIKFRSVGTVPGA